jgi:DNA invertase Pin-like site-specific DNA recombinase
MGYRRRTTHSPIKPRLGTNRYFAYVRVSTKPQEEKDLSLPAQRDAIHDYASRRGLEIVHVYEDVESAREPGRTQFTAMMEVLRKDTRIDGIICHKVDRLLRNFADYALVDEYIQAGVDFPFVTGNYDRSPVGKLGLGVQVLFAKHYIDNLSEEVKKGLHRRVLVEHRWAFPAPLGYMYQGVEKDADIVPDPERFPLLKKGWELLLSGQYSLRELTAHLATLGLRTRGNERYPAGNPIRPNVLHDVFSNPFYFGMMRFNGELLPGTHKPMITKDVFDRCQAILRNRGNPRPELKDFTYRGVMVCGNCGCTVTAEEHVKFYRGTGREATYVYYRCARSRGRCKERPVPERALEEQITSQLSAITLDENDYAALRAALQESFGHEQQYRRTTLEALRHRQDEVEKKRDVLTERYLEDRIAEEEYKRKYDMYRQELFAIGNEIERLTNTHELYIEEIELLLKLGSQLSGIYKSSDSQRKRAIVKLVALNVTLKTGKARLNLFPPFEVLRKVGSRPGWWALEDLNLRPPLRQEYRSAVR